MEADQESLDEDYKAFKNKKRQRKTIDKILPDNWELGSDKESYISCYAPVTGTGKKKKKAKTPSKKQKKEKKTIAYSFLDELQQDKEAMIQNRTETVSASEIPISKHNGNDNSASVRPLHDWLLTYSKSTANSVGDLRMEIVATLEDSILNPGNNSQQGTALDSAANTIATKPKRRQRKNTKNQKKRAKEIDKDESDAFFGEDKNDDDEPFGLLKAKDYRIFVDLEKDQRKREDKMDECLESAVGVLVDFKIDFEKIEKCSKAYCSAFLRQPRGQEYGERPCRRREKCICLLMAVRYPDSLENTKPEDGFVCMEFLLPSQLEKRKKDSTLPQEEQACLLCNRLLTTYWYYLCQFQNKEPKEILQNHQNFPIDEEGEYSSDYCIYPNPNDKNWTGIVRPIVKFSRANYVYAKITLTGVTSKKEITLKAIRETKLDFVLASVTTTSIKFLE